ncbi:MAG: acyltransferase family protein, partial [Brevundimonas sp.]
MTPVPTPPDLRALTTLRFLAALWVVLYTAWPHLDVSWVPVAVTKGYLGVETFFILSGFILSHVYLEAAGEKRFRYGGFLWARIARVYPLHLVTLFGMIGLGVAATIAGLSIDASLTDWRALPAHLTMTHAWGLAPISAFNHPSWSISAEWFAYLCFPAFAFVAWRLRNRPVLATGLAAAFALGLYAAFEPLAGYSLTEASFRWGMLRIVPCFALGCALYLVHRRGPIPHAGPVALASAAAVLASASLGLWDAITVLAAG